MAPVRLYIPLSYTINLLLLFTLVLYLPTSSTALAQTYPNKTIRVVVPYAAGGPIDMLSRPLAQKLTEALGVAVVIENRGGANGLLGAENIAKSAADGYSLLVGSGGGLSMGPHLYKKMPFDVFKDFSPISVFVTVPELLVVHPKLPVNSVKALISLAKKHPNALNFGSSGAGGPPHIAVELLKMLTHVEMVHVPYKGMGPATMDLVAGQIQLAFADLPVLIQLVKAQKLRALAVATQNRSENLPDVPTMGESGFPKVEAYNWYALFAPSGTSQEIINRIHSETVKIMSQPELKKFMQNQGAQATSSTPAELAALHKKEFDKWGQVIRSIGLTLE